MALILERTYLEAIPELSDSQLMEACAEAEPGEWQDAAIRELITERGYSRDDITDEIDRVLYLRAQERRADREEWMRYGDIDLAAKEGELNAYVPCS